MDNKFRTLYGKDIPNVVDYIKNYIHHNQDVELLIGADSQSYENRVTKYGVVIALYSKGRGAHVVCTRETVPIEHNMQMRLMNEVWKSVEIAEFLKNNGLPKPKFIDIDLNPDPKYKSNSMLRQAIGLVEGMGYRVRYKRNGASIQYAANHLVRI
jgi:predicted RNase H-related nuclease YkuK (DUF458 family)